MKKKRKSYLTALIAAIAISLISCQAKYITPTVTYANIEVVKDNQPDCTTYYLNAFDNPTEDNLLEIFHCLDQTIGYCYDEYEAIQVQLDAIYGIE